MLKTLWHSSFFVQNTNVHNISSRSVEDLVYMCKLQSCQIQGFVHESDIGDVNTC